MQVLQSSLPFREDCSNCAADGSFVILALVFKYNCYCLININTLWVQIVSHPGRELLFVLQKFR